MFFIRNIPLFTFERRVYLLLRAPFTPCAFLALKNRTSIYFHGFLKKPAQKPLGYCPLSVVSL